jgi:hypothetical protein
MRMKIHIHVHQYKCAITCICINMYIYCMYIYIYNANLLTLSTYFCSALSQIGQEHGLHGSSSRPARSYDLKSWIKLEYSLEPYQPKSNNS